jgi:outer membrane protein assembly factor BamB
MLRTFILSRLTAVVATFARTSIATIWRHQPQPNGAAGDQIVVTTQVVITFVILTCCSSSTLAADWPTYRHDNHRSGFTDEGFSGKSIECVWTHRSRQPPVSAWPGPARWDSYANIRGLSSMRNYDPCFHVVVAGDRVYFGSSADDSVRAVDIATGDTIWTFTTDGPVRIAPAFSEGRIYFGSDDGRAYCVKADNGELIWKSDRADDSRLILNDGRFVSLSPCRTGVLVDQSRAYYAQGMLPWRSTLLHCVDSVTGRTVDSAEDSGLFSSANFGLTLEGALLANDSRIVAPAGRVAPEIFDRANGKHEGPVEGSGGSSVVLTDNGQILCGPGNKTGWTTETDVTSRKQTTVHNGTVIAVVMPTARVMVSRSRLSAFDHSGKNKQWDVPCRHHSELIVAGQTILVGGEGAIAAFALSDGKLLWEYAVQGQVFGLAVANGRLFASTDEGTIHCFQPSDVEATLLAGPADDTSMTASTDALPKAAAESSAKERDQDQSGLLGHWNVHRDMSAAARRRGASNGDQRLSDITGNSHAMISGDVQIREVGGVEALEFDGETNTVLVTDDLTRAMLPKQSMTAEAWVRVDEADSIGGIIGCFQDTKTQHKGWTLGFHHSRFVFALAAAEGADGFTYLRGETPILPGHWYHVAATYDGKLARLSVNGHLEAESNAQSGSLTYPQSGFYEMGSHHDADTFHRMYGMLHEVRIYDRAVSDEEISRRYDLKRSKFNVPIELETGPCLQFETPMSARVRWETTNPTPTRLVLLQEGAERRFDNVVATNSHDVVIDGLPRDRMLHYAIEKETDGRVAQSLEFELDTHFNFSTSSISDESHPFSDDELSHEIQAAATHILSKCDFTRGVCLVLGSGDGRLAWELARQSELRIIGVDTDEIQVAASRQTILNTGTYGSRIAFHHVDSYATLPFVGRFANLIVSEDVITDGQPTADANELFRVLRPDGGMVCLGQPAGLDMEFDHDQMRSWLSPTGLEVDLEKNQHGTWLTAINPALEGAGDWSHLYGHADNSAFGGESLGGASTTDEMAVQWIGRPGPRAQPDRNGRKPSPLSTNGRLFVQGLHRLIAVDAFNGTILWGLEIPALERFNMPRDCSNWCADDQHVYIAAKDKCWQIDAATGLVVAFHPVVGSQREDWSYDWGFIAQVDDFIIGSAQKAGTAFTSFWGDAGAGWYDALEGPVTFKVCSDSLFVRRKNDGGIVWTYEDGVIINSTITVANEFVYFVESRSDKVKQSQARRIGSPELWQQQYLVALELSTGVKVWEKTLQTVAGNVAFYLAAGDDALVVNASTDKKYEVTAFAAADGASRWSQTFSWFENKGDHGKAIQRPAIVGGRVYVRPKVLDLKSGEILSLEMPSGKCGTYAATTKSLVFRTSNITMWNTASGSASSWDRMRPGCWLSTIPASGMLLSPEGGGGCSCGSWMEMSVGFMPVAAE